MSSQIIIMARIRVHLNSNYTNKCVHTHYSIIAGDKVRVRNRVKVRVRVWVRVGVHVRAWVRVL